jgi:hypothetical protein
MIDVLDSFGKIETAEKYKGARLQWAYTILVHVFVNKAMNGNREMNQEIKMDLDFWDDWMGKAEKLYLLFMTALNTKFKKDAERDFGGDDEHVYCLLQMVYKLLEPDALMGD